MAIIKELLIPVLFGVIGIIYYLTTHTFAEQSIVFPYAVMIVMSVLAVLIILSEYRKSRRNPQSNIAETEPPIPVEQTSGSIFPVSKPMLILGLSIVYLVLFYFTHFLIATVIFLGMTMICLKVPWQKSLVIAVVFALFLYLVFGKVFLVPI